jgi:hypothetical protein
LKARKKRNSKSSQNLPDPDDVLSTLIVSPKIRNSRLHDARAFAESKREKIRAALQAGNSLNVLSHTLAQTTQFSKESLRIVLGEMFPEFKQMRKSMSSAPLPKATLLSNPPPSGPAPPKQTEYKAMHAALLSNEEL